MGIVHFFEMFLKAKYGNFITDSSFGKTPFVFRIFLNERFSDSMALGV